MRIFEFRGETTSDDVVGVDHGFYEISRNIGVWLIRADDERLSLLQLQDIEEEGKDNSNVAVPVLVD